MHYSVLPQKIILIILKIFLKFSDFHLQKENRVKVGSANVT